MLDHVAAAVVDRHDPFELRTAALMGFPREEAARVLCLGLAPCQALEALATDLRRALEDAGQVYDAKPFRPHLTLARFHRAVPVGGYSAPPPATFTADRLVLYESRPQGCYAPLRIYSMRRV
jgi:2'-5' RNA ligase